MVDKFETEYACSTYILFNNKKEGILIDPGYNKKNCLLDHIKKLEVNIKAILITHGHYDHISALEDIVNAFPDVTCYINEDAEEEITNPRYNLMKDLNYLPANTKLLFDEEEIQLFDFIIKMFKTPGHTNGSCCYYLPNENILFSGDTLFYLGIGRIDLPSGSVKKIKESLRKLSAFPKETLVYPGHGPNTTIERELKYNNYLRNL